VNLHVLLQIGARAEALVAHIAQEGLFARVDPLVPNQIAHLGEGLVAALHLALERLEPIMHALMLL